MLITIKYILILTVLLTATTSLAQTSKTEKPIEVVTVCDVINNRSFYNGKFVAVIGRWSRTDEGFWLVDDCAKEIKTGDYIWDNMVSLEYDPSSPSAFPNKKMKLDETIVKEKIAEMKSRMKSTKDKIQWAVGYGRVETQEELQTAYAGDMKTLLPNGYGHLNAAPAQVVYKDKDIKILSNK